jgi:esterase/lipase
MNSEEVTIDCTGYGVKADWYQGTNDQVWLLLPGLTSNKKKQNELVLASTISTGASALVLDYAGHGVSPFEINDLTRAQNFSEVVRTFDWLKKNKPNMKVSVHGSSYGGFHAAYLTKFREFENVIFRAPASYPEETLFTVIGEMNNAHNEFYRSNPENYVDHWLFDHVSSVKGRALVITHEFDTVCPPVATSPFISAFRADHIEAKGFKHGIGESDATEEQKNEYYAEIADWIQK